MRSLLRDATEGESEGEGSPGYNCPGVIGLDVVGLMQAALDKAALPVRVTVIMNDTVGSLAAAAYHHGPGAKIGGAVCLKSLSLHFTLSRLINWPAATGANVSYLEKTERIGKVAGTGYAFPNMVIDTEWEEFGNDGQVTHSPRFKSRSIPRRILSAGSHNNGSGPGDRCCLRPPRRKHAGQIHCR